MEAGIAANSSEERKRRKYAALAEAHQFEPIAVETMEVYGGWVHWSDLEGDRPPNGRSDMWAQGD